MTDQVRVDHSDLEAMADVLAERIAHCLADGLERRGVAGLIVPGGTTPKPLFERLAAAPLVWTAVTVTLTDERWVPPDDPASNERLLRETLLRRRAEPARLLSLKTDSPEPESAESEISTRLETFPWPADAVLVGMGADGHIASLFPHAPGFERALVAPRGARCIALRPQPLPAAAPYPRLTLSLPALLDARRIFLMVRGAEKRETLAQADAGTDIEAMPVRAVLQQAGVPVEVHWAP